MNKFERQSRQPADHDTLPDEIAGELSHITTEVIDVSDAPPIAPPAPLTQDEVRTILMSLMLTMFLAALDQTIVATALPTIGRQFGDVSNLSWVITAYLLGLDRGGAGVRHAQRHLRPPRHDHCGAEPVHRGLGAVRGGAEHADPDPGARPAGARRRRHHAGRADGDFRRGDAARARPVPGLFQRRVGCRRDRRAGARRRVRRTSALVDDLLDQRAAGDRRAGAAAAEDGQDPGVPPQAQGRLARRRVADGRPPWCSCWC